MMHDFSVAAVIIHIGVALPRGDVKLHPSMSSEEAGRLALHECPAWKWLSVRRREPCHQGGD